MAVLTGLDVLRRDGFSTLRGRRIALLVNQASLARDYRHALDLLLPLHRSGFLHIATVFGPEHGLYGHTQDNMIEWEGEPDERTGLIVHSLYGRLRKPDPSWLAGVDLFVSDIPDVGSRYYTFVWTMAHCLERCAELGLPALVLDRPNPIGNAVEGPVLDPAYSSFVGLYPVPTRHGLTPGGMARWLQKGPLPALSLDVVEVEGWNRERTLHDQDAVWAMPSPNMPTPDTALVYPGGCLLEGTNLSEGRGTTRPFEIFGAPFLDGWALAEDLNGLGLPGVVFRPLPFEPTFNKHAGRLCGGCFVHVTDRAAFRPVLTYVAVLQACVRQTGLGDPSGLPEDETFRAASPETTLDQFAWKRPPYEYVRDRRPIDILAGNDWLAPMIGNLKPLARIEERMREESKAFQSDAE